VTKKKRSGSTRLNLGIIIIEKITTTNIGMTIITLNLKVFPYLIYNNTDEA